MGEKSIPPVRELLRREVMELDVQLRAEGHKSSEGDGRTAADIRRERQEKSNAQ